MNRPYKFVFVASFIVLFIMPIVSFRIAGRYMTPSLPFAYGVTVCNQTGTCTDTTINSGPESPVGANFYGNPANSIEQSEKFSNRDSGDGEASVIDYNQQLANAFANFDTKTGSANGQNDAAYREKTSSNLEKSSASAVPDELNRQQTGTRGKFLDLYLQEK